MTSHQQIYKAANWLGAGCLLLSVFMGSIQLLMKAGHQHETDEKKALNQRLRRKRTEYEQPLFLALLTP
ncbi:MAG: hypothetical protein LH702_16215, partial [Phormidesmis sp. CAN_BIN44]|nr:hypothetical protein [Phormidesmis sp. CAN_BIN44]